MKANKLVKGCGPYEVRSISQDRQGIRLEVYPAFPEYNLSVKERNRFEIDQEWLDEPRWAMHRYKGDGGGPGIFTAMALATALENFLNQGYTAEQVKDWKDLNALALKKVRDREKKVMERAFDKMEREQKQS